jgi:hypothetical protein
MKLNQRVFFASAVLTIGLTTAGLVLANPGAAVCALIERSGLTALEHGIYVESELTASEQDETRALVASGKDRIGQMFGPPVGKPIIVFFQNEDVFWPIKLNRYGSTHFIGKRACVMIGPEGRGVDVVAHEIMHSELFARVGYWRRFVSVPVWLDEGIAMQVDHRSAYDLPPDQQMESVRVRRLESARQFFVHDEDALTRHYAAAKSEVSRWLGEVGHGSLYDRLERLRTGEPLDRIMAR